LLQVAEKEQTLSAEDEEEWSSHGTEDSGDAFMEVTRDALDEIECTDVATLFSVVATFSRGQAMLFEKIAQLERTVGTVQFDMTWVRDDMKAVHQVMERIAEDVCDLREGAAEIEVRGEQVPLDAHRPTPRRGSKHAATEIEIPGEQVPLDAHIPAPRRGSKHVATEIEIPGEQVPMDVYRPAPWRGNKHAATEIELPGEQDPMDVYRPAPWRGNKHAATEIDIPGEQVSMDVYRPTPWKGNEPAETDIDIPVEQESMDVYTPPLWKRNEHAANVSKGPSASTSSLTPQSSNDYAPIRNVSRDVPVNYRDDTPEFMFSTDVHYERMPSKDGGRLEGEPARCASPALWSPPGEQQRVSIEEEPLEEDSERIEMSCRSTQPPPPAIGRGMWSDFAAAVRGWPAPTEDVVGLEEGWLSPKKGRWDTTVYGNDEGEPFPPLDAEVLGTLNLNLLPERNRELETTYARGSENHAESSRGGGRKGGIGRGRGPGRGRGLPAVSPRFHTPVRMAPPPTLNVCLESVAMAQIRWHATMCDTMNT
jgi:hypothetical protein